MARRLELACAAFLETHHLSNAPTPSRDEHDFSFNIEQVFALQRRHDGYEGTSAIGDCGCRAGMLCSTPPH